MIYLPGPNYYEDYLRYRDGELILSAYSEVPVPIKNSTILYLGYSLFSNYYSKCPSNRIIDFIEDFEDSIINSGISVFALPNKKDSIGIYFIAKKVNEDDDNELKIITKIEESIGSYYSSFYIEWLFRYSYNDRYDY